MIRSRSYSPFQALLDDLHVQHAEEAAAESEPQGVRGLRLVVQRRIVQNQLAQRVAEGLEVVARHGKHARVDLRLDRLEPGHGVRIGRGTGHQRIAHRRTPDVLDAGDQVADFPRRQGVLRFLLGVNAPTSSTM